MPQSIETTDESGQKNQMDIANLICVDLDQPSQVGFRKFISSWLYRGDGFSFLLDPGPLTTIPKLVCELRRLGLKRLDYVLLTHIHIDHAGGTGELLKTFPEAKVICHPEGIRHMVAPEKLWQGSRQVLGRLAEVFGEIVPVPKTSIGYEEQIGASGIRVFLTPGHAQHHCCYLLDDLLFAGEVAGVRSEVDAGIYMRPATPPRFRLEIALDSLERMLALAPRRMVFAHYGRVDRAQDYLQIACRQLRLWVQGTAATATVDASQREEAFFAWLLEKDEIYRNIRHLPADIYARERIFLSNTLRGMVEYVEGLTAQERQQLADA